MKFTMSVATVTADVKNCSYPTRVEVTDADVLAEATKRDHVCGEFAKNYRNTANFQKSNVVVMDCDNDSDNPEDWISIESLEDIFENISYAIVPSRHHMVEKDGKPARPKFHVYFPIEETANAEDYAALKRAIQKAYSFFDDNALDAARFIFGADVGGVVWHEGWMNIDEEVEVEDFDEGLSGGGPIVAGTRNNTLSRFAGRVLKRYGECDKAHEIFMEEADKCDPPLADSELKTIWYSALKFFRNKVSNQNGYVPPDSYNDDFGGAGSLKPSDYSDIGQAKVLSREYGDELCYSDATDYLRYDGECWREDKQYSIGACEEFLDLQLADAHTQMEELKKSMVQAGVPKDVVKDGKALEKYLLESDLQLYYKYKAAQQYIAFVMKRRDYKYIVSALNTAKPMLAVDVNDLDKNENLLNTPYATYDLRKGVSGEQPHNPEDLITKITECSPGDEGQQIWLDSLLLFFCGDAELIEYVQKVVGMAAIGKVYQEHLIIAYGGGANGKSTFWNVIARVLGSYSGKLSAETLTVGCKRNVKPEMAELKGKRLIIASEMEEGMRLNTAVVKQLCSTDEIYAEKKYKAPFSFTPSHTLVLYTNHLPRVSANDDGIWRRLIVIPFNAKITGASDIKNYAEHLFENAGPAILSWIIEGTVKAIADDFKPATPKCVEAAIMSYREENDWLGHFLTECCDVDATLQEKSGELYQQYRAYCISNGEYIRSTADFYAAMDKLGFERHRTKAGSMVRGVQLKAGADFAS